MYDIVALGEILIDFTPAGSSPAGNQLFEKNPGGAPANLLACATAYGSKTAMIGAVGDDIFGEFLVNVLKEHQISTLGMQTTKDARTTLAFVELDANGERTFAFYRKPGADLQVEFLDEGKKLVEGAKLFHFGSLSLTDLPARDTTYKLLQTAERCGALISYDPNLRMSLWNSPAEAKEKILSVMPAVDILKISEEELTFLTDEERIEEGAALLMDQYHPEIILVTRGKEGCYYRTETCSGMIPSFKVDAVDATGAGDIFFGSFLHLFLKNKLYREESFNESILQESIQFACAAAALSTTKKGGIPSIPDRNAVIRFMKEGQS